MAGIGRLFRVEIELKHWLTALINTTNENASDALWMAGMQIKEVARLMAPRETGAMMNSIALVSAKKSTYNSAVLTARRMRPGAEVQGSPLAGKNEVYIVPVVGYAGHQEFGTSRNRAQPFLIPALRAVGPKVLSKAFGVEVFGRYKQKPPIIERWTF
jgi:HK97 gp10 family phage protein